MFWGLFIAVLVVGALAYGWWDHRKQSRTLSELLQPLAREHSGTLKPASFLVQPQLRFKTGGYRFMISQMASHGAIAVNQGPSTFATLELSRDTGQQLRIVPATGIDSRISGLLHRLGPGGTFASGDPAFDAVYRVEGRDATFAGQLLDARMRRSLLETRLNQPDVAIKGDMVSVHMRGAAESRFQIEALIDLALLIAERCTETSE